MAGALIDAISNTLQAALRDGNSDNWTEEIVWRTIAEAEKVIANYRPDSTAVSINLALVAGVEQSIGTVISPPLLRVLDVKYNLAQQGLELVAGRAVRRVAMNDVDAMSPNWRVALPVAEVREYMVDEREPLIFHVKPPVIAGTKVRVLCSAEPETSYVTGPQLGQRTTISGVFEPMIVEWCLYRLFGQDVEGSVNVARSQQHLKNFEAMMGAKLQGEKIFGGKADGSKT
jgi:hypothetical protein